MIVPPLIFFCSFSSTFPFLFSYSPSLSSFSPIVRSIMGNSQSFERTANKGLKLFRLLKKLQKEFDKNKNNNNNNNNNNYNNYNNNNNHHQQSYGGGGGNTSSSHQYHPHEEDSADYTRLRELAHQEAEKRNHCYEQSQEAYQSGDGAKGK